MTYVAAPRGEAKWPSTSAALLVLIIGAALMGFTVIANRDVEDFGDLILLIAAVVFTAVGALIIARSDRNRIGWVVSATGLALLASGVLGYLSDQGSLVASAIGGALWFSFLFLVGLLMFWFPTGQPLSPKWRWVGRIGFSFEILSLSFIVSEQLCMDASGGTCQVWVDNPIGINGVPDPEYGSLSGLTLGILGAFVLLSAVSLIVRAVRARGVERLQIKWFALAVGFVISGILLQETVADRVSAPEVVWNLVFGISVLALPAAIGVVLKYRLYEIDRIISRTVAYTLVVGLLGAVFFGVVTALSSVLQAESQVAVAGSTLAVAALFNPVRKRVQVRVDSRFNRSLYDAQRVMDRFTGSLQARVVTQGVVDGWVGVVSETMQPASVAVWVKDSSTGSW